MRRTARRLTPLVALALASGVVGVVLGGAGTGVAASTARPTNTQPPTVSGTPEVGRTLTAREGTWTGSPTDYDYAWRRCDQDGGSCSLISGASERTYLLKQVDQGNTLRVSVTAQNADGRTTATSRSTWRGTMPTSPFPQETRSRRTTGGGCSAFP
jgi:hypothetical protein